MVRARLTLLCGFLLIANSSCSQSDPAALELAKAEAKEARAEAEQLKVELQRLKSPNPHETAPKSAKQTPSSPNSQVKFPGTLRLADGTTKNFVNLVGFEKERTGPLIGQEVLHKRSGLLFMEVQKPDRTLNIELSRIKSISFGSKKERSYDPVEVQLQLRDGTTEKLLLMTTWFEITTTNGNFGERYTVQLFAPECPFHGATLSFGQ